jgi:formylglycine-generating enzyme required for sulfatase activity
MEFCRRLSQRTGRTTPCRAKPSGNTPAGRAPPLPSTSAPRSPRSWPITTGTTPTATAPRVNIDEQSTDVASFPANAWGLHDMHGNVWEWCLILGTTTTRERQRMVAPGWIQNAEKATRRLLRGGSWNSRPRELPLGLPRPRRLPGYRDDFVGFPRLLPPPGLCFFTLKHLKSLHLAVVFSCENLHFLDGEVAGK